MSINRAELKSLAKEQIKGNVWTFFGLSLVLGIILSVSSFVVIGPLLLAGPLELGLTLFMIEVVRTKKGNFNTGFAGFKQFGSSFVATLLMGIFICLWSCLFVIPGIIACFRYSLTYYILADKKYLKDKFIEFFPPAIKQKAANILHDITTKVGNYVRAQLLSMVAVGLMVALVAAILGIDYPILLGLMDFMGHMVQEIMCRHRFLLM